MPSVETPPGGNRPAEPRRSRTRYSSRQVSTWLMEALIRTSGWATSAAVLLIIVFLFREGLDLTGSKPLTEDLVLAVRNDNPVKRLTAREVRALHEKDIKNWKELGGVDAPVVLFNLNNVDKFASEQVLGEHFERLPVVVDSIAQQHPGILLTFPPRYLPASVRTVQLDNISLGQFLGGKQWYPTANPSPEFGALPLILGTFWVTLGAILIALPLGLAVSLYLAEMANERVRTYLKPTIELLAGIPSVVYGFFGLVVVVPLIQQTFNLSVGETALAGSIMLALIALPTIITVSEDALKSTPRAMKEASLALGATHWETIRRVTIPYGINGITAATILGVGRAVGETMTVLMVTGNAAVLPTSFLQPVRTLSATIAAELGEAPQGGLHYKALFLVGCVLFVVTFIFNLLAGYVAERSRLQTA